MVPHDVGDAAQLFFGITPVSTTASSDTSLTFVVSAALQGASSLYVVNAANDLRSDALPLEVANPKAGSGKDGVGTLSGTVTFARTTLAQTASAGDTRLVLATTGAALSAGDLALVIDLQGASAGRWEIAGVTAVDGTTATLRDALANTYPAPDRVMVQRVPQYSDATLTGTVTAAGWNGSTGGVFDTPACPEPSAGGGGHGTAGGNGRIDSSNNCFSEGGAAYGDSALQRSYFGSAGGRTMENAAGGSGGGIVIVTASAIGRREALRATFDGRLPVEGLMRPVVEVVLESVGDRDAQLGCVLPVHEPDFEFLMPLPPGRADDRAGEGDSASDPHGTRTSKEREAGGLCAATR